MLNCSIEGMLDLWIDFWLAREGDHHYGGHTAEIYAYRLEPYSPSLHREGMKPDKLDKFFHYSKVAQSLVDLLDNFCRKYDCTATIDGRHPAGWLKDHGGHFDWRCYVEIHPIENERQANQKGVEL